MKPSIAPCVVEGGQASARTLPRRDCGPAGLAPAQEQAVISNRAAVSARRTRIEPQAAAGSVLEPEDVAAALKSRELSEDRA